MEVMKVVMIVLMLSFTFFVVVRASVDKGFMSNHCNPQKSSIYEDLEAPLLQEIVWQTAHSNGYEYYGRSTSHGEKSYGHGACTGTLTQTECTDCIVVAADELSAACPSDVGGQTQLRDCRVRIERYYFHNDG